MNSRIEIASCFKVNGRLGKQECTTDIRVNDSVLVNEMPKSARYHIDRANSIVFTSKGLPLHPVSAERLSDEIGCSATYNIQYIVIVILWLS